MCVLAVIRPCRCINREEGERKREKKKKERVWKWKDEEIMNNEETDKGVREGDEEEEQGEMKKKP